MRKNYYHTIFTLLLVVYPFFQVLYAQSEDEKLVVTILQKDSLFWNAYNHCETDQYPELFTEDVEFYHDKGGIILGLTELTATVKKNLCGTGNFRLRREAVQGTVKVYPLHNAGIIYGAIISGDHVFYVNETGKAERLDGLASFTHLWLLKDGKWKMTRILSYDHGPASRKNQKKEITLSNTVLDQFTGTYKGPKTGIIKIQRENGFLKASTANSVLTLYAETDNRFFVKDRDLSFEFTKKVENKISKMVVHENGQVVEEAVWVRK